jgi:hypothetical protein
LVGTIIVASEFAPVPGGTRKLQKRLTWQNRPLPPWINAPTTFGRTFFKSRVCGMSRVTNSLHRCSVDGRMGMDAKQSTLSCATPKIVGVREFKFWSGARSPPNATNQNPLDGYRFRGRRCDMARSVAAACRYKGVLANTLIQTVIVGVSTVGAGSFLRRPRSLRRFARSESSACQCTGGLAATFERRN